ncbi:hypothetical protein ACLE20_00355 [Rhizobium sp. YIM 134829]|uniref:hypothetical protein n=1 Tax=Rhizobium sp. YIM 134829 TaxID=3390453 RepID=UPI00397C988E
MAQVALAARKKKGQRPYRPRVSPFAGKGLGGRLAAAFDRPTRDRAAVLDGIE